MSRRLPAHNEGRHPQMAQMYTDANAEKRSHCIHSSYLCSSVSSVDSSAKQIARRASLLATVFFAVACSSALFAREDPDDAVTNGQTALRDSYNRPWYDSDNDSLRRIQVRERAPREDSGGTLDAPNLDFLTVLAWVVLGALLLVVAYFLVMAYLRRENTADEMQTSNAKRDYDVADRVEALPFMARRDQSDLLGQARRHYEAGNFAEAIIYLFSYQLVELDRHGIVHLDRGKTNRQYLREARTGGLHTILDQTMVAFEDVFFGAHQLDRRRFEQCWNQLDEFQSKLRAAA
jgi:hypothetical protein